MRLKCSGIASESASISINVAMGRSRGRSTPAPSTLHGEVSIKPSITAVRIMDESNRYDLDAVLACLVDNSACQPRIFEGASPVRVACPSTGRT